MSYAPGRHFLQIPGPTNCPLPVLAAIAQPTIDHRGPEFGVMAKEVLASIRTIFKTKGPVIIYPGSGTGAWEAALVNTLSPGDKVLMYETGWFADALEQARQALRHRGRAHYRRLAGGCRCRQGDRGAARRRQGRDHQGRLRRPQRDLDGRDLQRGGRPRRPRPRRPSGPAAGRCGVLARLDRLPPRRMGRRRHRVRLPEGPDAAAGPRLQCRLRQGAPGRASRRGLPRSYLGLGGDARQQRQGVSSRRRPAPTCCRA